MEFVPASRIGPRTYWGYNSRYVYLVAGAVAAAEREKEEL